MWKSFKDWSSRLRYFFNLRIDVHTLSQDGWVTVKTSYSSRPDFSLSNKHGETNFHITETNRTNGKSDWLVSYECKHFGNIERYVKNRYELYLFVNAVTLNLEQ